MPSSHPRIAVVRDPELDRALSRAGRALPGTWSTAAVLRELALRGARALEADAPVPPVVRWLREEHGARPSTRRPGDVLGELEPLGAVDHESPYRASRVLDDLREDRS